MAITVDKAGTPIKITGTTTTDDEVIAQGTSVFVKFIYWYNPTAVGHLVNLKQGDGRQLIPLRCETANESQLWPLWTQFNGLRVDDMDSGTLYIYIR